MNNWKPKYFVLDELDLLEALSEIREDLQIPEEICIKIENVFLKQMSEITPGEYNKLKKKSPTDEKQEINE